MFLPLYILTALLKMNVFFGSLKYVCWPMLFAKLCIFDSGCYLNIPKFRSAFCIQILCGLSTAVVYSCCDGFFPHCYLCGTVVVG